MKKIISLFIIISVGLAAMPLLVFLKTDKKPGVVTAAVPKTDIADGVKSGKPFESFKIKLSNEKIKTINAEDYVIGVLAGEISPTYEKEAIKAQAVASYTFACRRAATARNDSRDFDLTDSGTTDQCYIDKSKMKEKWGDRYEEYHNIYKSCVKEVSGQVLTYGGDYALTVYHAISSGKTESSENVWGTALPYLVPVESLGDKLANGYLSTVTLTEAEAAEKLKNIIEISSGKNAFADITRSESGRVLKVGGKDDTAAEIVTALGLRSFNFEVSYQNGGYTFKVYGSGHGVGMSQQGALYMAKQGSDYKEILLHYYKGCKIK